MFCCFIGIFYQLMGKFHQIVWMFRNESNIAEFSEMNDRKTFVDLEINQKTIVD